MGLWPHGRQVEPVKRDGVSVIYFRILMYKKRLQTQWLKIVRIYCPCVGVLASCLLIGMSSAGMTGGSSIVFLGSPSSIHVLSSIRLTQAHSPDDGKGQE